MGEVNWSEHLFMEPHQVEKKEAEDGKIQIRLLDKGFLKNGLIGSFDFDLSYIYFMKDHILLHKWLAVSDPNSENYSEITGYIKVSISVAATGDEQIQITEDDDNAKEEDEILMPPQLNPKFYQMIIRFFQAQNIPPMDSKIFGIRGAKTDAYMVTKYKGRKLKTKVKLHEAGDESYNDWNEEIWMPAQIPIISGRAVFHLMDEDVDCDEMVGSVLFDIQDIVDGKVNAGGVVKGKMDPPPYWKNIYGSPMNLSGSSAKKQMNNNPDVASNWKGRILMQVQCYETEKPIAKVCRIEEDLVLEA